MYFGDWRECRKRLTPPSLCLLVSLRRRLRDDKREDREILDYLKSENEYSQSATAHLKGLQDSLYKEFLSR